MNGWLIFLYVCQTLQDHASGDLVSIIPSNPETADKKLDAVEVLISSNPEASDPVVSTDAEVSDPVVSTNPEASDPVVSTNPEASDPVASTDAEVVLDTQALTKETKAVPLSYDEFKNNLISYYVRNYDPSPFSVGSSIRKLKFLISSFELQDKAHSSFQKSCCKAYGNLEDSMKSFISKIYSDEPSVAEQIQGKVPEFLSEMDALFATSYSNFLNSYNREDYDLWEDLYLIANYHLERGNIVASSPKHFILRIFYVFINKGIKFFQYLEKHSEFMQMRSEDIKNCVEEFKKAIGSLSSLDNAEGSEAVLSFASSCKAFIENALISCGAEDIAFKSEQGFSKKERKAAFDLIIRSKAIIGILDVFSLFLDPSLNQDSAFPDFEDLKIFLTNYFFDYEKIGYLCEEDTQVPEMFHD